jgi:hypothetical protein
MDTHMRGHDKLGFRQRMALATVYLQAVRKANATSHDGPGQHQRKVGAKI